MVTLEELTIQDVVQLVRQWPEAERRVLLHALVDIVGSSTAEIAPPQPRLSTWNDLRGISASHRPPPSDEEVEQWLDERRMRHANP